MPQPKTKSKSCPSSGELNRAAWEAACAKAQEMSYEAVPQGWVDYDKFAVAMGLCREVAAQKLRVLARLGLAERRDFRVRWGNVIRPRPYFRLK